MIPYVEQPSWALGPVSIHAFGLILAGSIICGLVMGQRRFQRLGLDAEIGARLAWWALAGGILGAHLFSVLLYFPEKIVENPLVILKLWEDISSFGGIIGGLLGVWLFFRLRARSIRGAHRWAYLDAIAYVFPVALMVGRIACSLAHDHPGTLTAFPLAISLNDPAAQAYIHSVYAGAGRLVDLPPPDVLRHLAFHDLGWYEFLYLALIVVPVTLGLGGRRRAPGFFFTTFILLYVPVRFLLDFLRVADVTYLELTPAQWVALPLLIWAAVLGVRWRWLNRAG